MDPLPFPPPRPGFPAALRANTYRDETALVDELLAEAPLDPAQTRRVAGQAARLAQAVRDASGERIGVETFLQEFSLSTAEGVALMCLAEALLRIPDSRTVDALIRDKIGGSRWEQHVGHGESLLVNASSWALMLTGRLASWAADPDDSALAILRRLVARSGEPVIRLALQKAMRLMAGQFVMGETMADALGRAAEAPAGYRHSFDMLGEAARTAADAARYLEEYRAAIAAVAAVDRGAPLEARPGISIKLSALHPRYEEAKAARVRRELLPRVLDLARQARAAGIGLTVDAEEADRLVPSLELFAALAHDPSLAGWDGLGLAVQAYQKRAVPVIDWLVSLAGESRRRLMVRLVKGAYWDSEIKWAQERGLDGFPVFTRKPATDLSYLVCAARLLAAGDRVFGQFATHNAHTLAAILEMAGTRRDFEFQKLHGMGDALYRHLLEKERPDLAVRVYAPVGSHRDLLAYLVRRLLENGANTSFIHQIADRELPIETLVADPIAALRRSGNRPARGIRLPQDLFDDRRNAHGLDLADRQVLNMLADRIARDRAAASPGLESGATPASEHEHTKICEPADRRRPVGSIASTGAAALERLLATAAAAAPGWRRLAPDARAACLERASDAFEAERLALISLLVREGGKTLPDAVAELREAVDFLRYYAVLARTDFPPQPLPGPTGERNTLQLQGRGVFACISPWNFPLAIFTGQVAAALAAGNAVIAKPAEQTPLIAAKAMGLLHRAGVPPEILALAVGDGPTVGAPLAADSRIAGVAFTGSTETAQAINRALAARGGPIVPLIAETGGLNAMIVDSSALPEQVVADVLASAFHSAGQRCSALRMLFVQRDIAPRLLDMLAGAMAELAVGDPADPATDIGPVIDAAARDELAAYAEALKRRGRVVAAPPLPPGLERGTYVPPVAVEVDLPTLPAREVFGPILHVVPYAADRLDAVIDHVNGTGYGLTLGIQSRLDGFAETIRQRVSVGNIYVNRSMIGAVVGVQPFGGQGLSGTGPKAGGPRYLHRFATECTVSVNTAASGGNAALMAGLDEG